MRTINYPEMDVVAKFFGQCSFDDIESASLVVGQKVFDIFEQECARLFLLDNPGHIKKERSLGLVMETMSPAQRIFLLTPAIEKGWQGKPASRTL